VGKKSEHPARSAGVVGSARRKSNSGNRGRPVVSEDSGLFCDSDAHIGMFAELRSFWAHGPHAR
jgi:hypothetical protein